MKKSVLLAVILASHFVCVSVFAATRDEFIKKGNEHVQKKDYKKAVAAYEEAVKADPSSSKAHLLLGLTYANTGELDKAIRESKASIAIQPSYTGYHNLGLIYANQSKFEEAQSAYKKALELSPESSRTWYQMGLTASASGDFKGAIEYYNKSLEGNIYFAEAYLGLAAAHYWTGDKESAKSQVQRLRDVKQESKAAQLEEWIAVNEKKNTPSTSEPQNLPVEAPTE